MEDTKKITKKHKILLGVFVAGLIIAVPVIFFMATFKSVITVEAGTEMDEKLLWKTGIILPVTMDEEIDTSIPGTKNCKVKIWYSIPAEIRVEVCDTTPPKAMIRNLVVHYKDSCTVEDFVIDCMDTSSVSYEFIKAPDCKKIGTQIVTIKFTDENGNTRTAAATVTVMGILTGYTMELGQEVPTAQNFVLDDSITAKYVTEPDPSKFSEPGEYKAAVLFNGKEEMVTIYVADRTDPVVEVSNKETWVGKPLVPQDFVVSIQDASETVVEFRTEPDFTKDGTQNLGIVVKDSSGNVTEKEVVLTVKKDTTAPTIKTSYIKVTVNGSISYKKSITVSDDCDDASDIILSIDNSGVNLSAVGSYTVICRATDTSGNTATKNITVEVVSAATEVHTQEEINHYCDEVLARIMDDSMSMEEKAYAIYRWTRSNIGYVNNSPKDDWLLGAYNGLVKRQGDCFTYAATAKALLERIGLEPLVIKKEKTPYTSQSNHYWLLLDLGNGLYHYDPTPRKDGTWFFMWTDADIKAYSDAHSGSHNFTRSNYPAIQ